MNTISECLYVLFGLERGHQLSTLAPGVGWGGHAKCLLLRTVGGVATSHVYLCTCTISFHVLAAFLSNSDLLVLFVEI